MESEPIDFLIQRMPVWKGPVVIIALEEAMAVLVDGNGNPILGDELPQEPKIAFAPFEGKKSVPPGRPQVKEAVRELLRVKQEVFMPLIHRVGEAQVDFGYGPAKVSLDIGRRVCGHGLILLFCVCVAKFPN